MTISAVIIAKNEADNIERCLKSLKFTSEQIVIDAESTDPTVALAQKLGARTFVKPWQGYGKQKNFGLQQVKSEWVLFVDADEEVSPQLRQEIQTIIKNPNYDFYWLKILTYFLGRPLTHLTGHNPRLFRAAAGQWTDSFVHEQVTTKHGQKIKLNDALSGKLTTPLNHYSHPTIKSYLARMHHYTTLDAKEMAKTHQHRSGRTVKPHIFLPYVLATRQFIKLYFYRHGLLDGYTGLMWSSLSAYYEYEMAKKYLKLCA